MEYELIRSARKSISIQVSADARVIVRAPKRASKRVIDGFVTEKQGWIARGLVEASARLSQKQEFEISEGSRLLLLGQEYPVILRAGKPVFGGQAFFLPPGSAQDRKSSAIRLYRKLAKETLAARVSWFSQQMGLNPAAVKVNGAAKRWGSCSGSNSLNFSWRLVLAPPEAVDYVAVHELAHIRHHDHSASFWGLVGSVLPDYKEREKLLAALQARLAAEDWGEPK